jgi:RHS repeat-associated protein
MFLLHSSLPDTKPGEKRYPENGSSAIPTTYRYTGQRQEILLGGLDGLYFYGARWYDSSLGRFLSADTLIPQPGDPQAWDRFAYASNNSLRYIDPTGHMISSAIHDSDGDAQCNDPYHCLDANGKLAPSGLIHLYRKQYDLDNRMNSDDVSGREMLSKEIDDYQRSHPEYDETYDPNLGGYDEFLYEQIRAEYWLQRAGGNFSEAYNLRMYYDYNNAPPVSNWDSSRVDWSSVAIDATSFGLSFVGLNPVAKLGKVAPLANLAAIGNAAGKGDPIGTGLGFASFWPGPPGVIFSGASVLHDLSAGFYTNPYVPSIPR